MASTSGPGTARDTRADDLDRLVERGLEANVVGRGALAATLFSRADALASQLHDDTCLVPAWLQYCRTASLFEWVCGPASVCVGMRPCHAGSTDAQGSDRLPCPSVAALRLSWKGWRL